MDPWRIAQGLRPMDEFIAVTNAQQKEALSFLEMTSGNVQRAIELWCELGGQGSQHHQPEQSVVHEPPRNRKRRLVTRPERRPRTRSEPKESSSWPSTTQERSEPPIRQGLQLAERMAQLARRLLSAAVMVQAPADAEDVPARLSPKEVVGAFEAHVPGVHDFVYRQVPGQYSLTFIQSAYRDGLAAFRNTPLHSHLTALLRTVVHHGHEGKPGAKAHLTEVAEAFMDCQAVQARAIERVGLRICGGSLDFRRAVELMVGEYKTMALRMLAAERLQQGVEHDDENPTHYENRLTADLGHELGLNQDDIRRAELDEHARNRFRALKPGKFRNIAAARCRELFDMEAFFKAFVAEIGGLNDESLEQSLPRLFIAWASERFSDPFIILDEETMTPTNIDETLALAVLEVLFLGQPCASADETYRGAPVNSLFKLS